ncbi:hypothetical protein QSH57_014343 [Fusarium oxysporum f. sp. vasinfectum]|nr:hypothetical protein QSH57_014343 [Fusarium oxysporum f. sp. vasinfectum]
MSEAEKTIDDLVKRPSSQGVYQRLKNKFSSLTQQPSMNNAVKNPESPGRGSINSIQKSVELNVPNGPRSPRSPVWEPSQLATQPNGTAHTFPVDGQDPQDNFQISPSVQSPSSELPTESHDVNRVCTPKDFQFEQSEELQPASPAHQTQVMAASRDENISYGQNDLAMTLKEQLGVINDLIAQKESLSQQLEAERQQRQKDLAYWRNRTSEAASKSANLVPGMPLSQPDTELRNEWRNLAFDVRNFVDNHFKNTLLLYFGVIIVLSGFCIFTPWNSNSFITTYIGIPLIGALFCFLKVFKKTKCVSSTEADSHSDKVAIDAIIWQERESTTIRGVMRLAMLAAPVILR